MAIEKGDKVRIKDEVFEGEGIVVKKIHAPGSSDYVVSGISTYSPPHLEYWVKITKIEKRFVNPFSLVAAIGGGFARKGDVRRYYSNEVKKLSEVI